MTWLGGPAHLGLLYALAVVGLSIGVRRWMDRPHLVSHRKLRALAARTVLVAGNRERSHGTVLCAPATSPKLQAGLSRLDQGSTAPRGIEPITVRDAAGRERGPVPPASLTGDTSAAMDGVDGPHPPAPGSPSQPPGAGPQQPAAVTQPPVEAAAGVPASTVRSVA